MHSEWNFTRQLDALNQGGAFKIFDGVIYNLDTCKPIGQSALDAAGQFHLVFQGHRKNPEGDAIVRKVANGEFRGVLIFGGDLKSSSPPHPVRPISGSRSPSRALQVLRSLNRFRLFTKNQPVAPGPTPQPVAIWMQRANRRRRP